MSRGTAAFPPARPARPAKPSRRHGASGVVLAQQSRAAIDGGTFHNDVVCVGALDTLFFHELAFEDTEATKAAIRRAAETLAVVKSGAAVAPASAPRGTPTGWAPTTCP